MRNRLSVMYVFAFLASVLELLYELLIAQTLTVLSGNSVAKYSLTIGLYLAASGFGAWLGEKKFSGKAERSIIVSEWCASVLGGLMVPALYFFYIVQNDFSVLRLPQHSQALAVFIGVSVLVIATLGILKGISFALLIVLGRRQRLESVNAILGADYFGALVGTLLFAFSLQPYFGLFQIAFAAAAANAALLAVFGWWLFGRSSATLASVPLIIILAIFWLRSDVLEQHLLKKFWYRPYAITANTLFSSTKNLPSVELYRSPYQEITLVQTTPNQAPEQSVLSEYRRDLYILRAYSDKLDKDFPFDYLLSLNGYEQLHTGSEELNAEFFVHVPFIANGIPRRVLIIGGGDGTSTREVLKYPQVEQVVQVEIDPVMAELALEHPLLRFINADAFHDPRLQLIIDDGFSYLRDHHERYDAILIDIQAPYDYSLSKMFSKEFFGLVRSRLTQQGFTAILSAGITDRRHWEIFYNTLRSAGFAGIVPYFTALEDNNPDGQQRIAALNNQVLTDENRSAIQAQLRKFLLNTFTVGHLYATVQEQRSTNPFADDTIPLHVLNAQRYALSFDYPYVFFNPTVATDASKVNSILRPTLYDLLK